MVLKKQTVWLMTMLSLTIVLAVYYITSPNEVAEEPGESEDVGVTAEEEEWIEWLSEEEMKTTIEETEPTMDGEVGDISNEMAESSGSLFSELRLEREESRSRMQEEYTNAIASGELSAAEKSEAFEKREALQELQHNEQVLESLIQAEGYEDVVVIADNDRARIIVQADELTKEEAVMINRLAAEHLDITDVVIGHHATASN